MQPSVITKMWPIDIQQSDVSLHASLRNSKGSPKAKMSLRESAPMVQASEAYKGKWLHTGVRSSSLDIHRQTTMSCKEICSIAHMHAHACKDACI